MRIVREFKRGQLVEILNDQATRNYYGWDHGMDKYMHTVQKVSEFFSPGLSLVSCPQYTWHRDDVKLMPPKGVQEVILNGEEQLFDINELD